MGERCKSCNAEVIWAHLPNDKRMPVDAKASDTGNLVLVRRGGRVLALPFNPEKHGVAGPRRVSHFATCPDAAGWRKTLPPHSCGSAMQQCEGCGEFVCDAPGHARHACVGRGAR